LGKVLIEIKDVVPGKEQVAVKFLKGPALTEFNFGNPLSVGQLSANAWTLFLILRSCVRIAPGQPLPNG
jgi:hypothetical protein